MGPQFAQAGVLRMLQRSELAPQPPLERLPLRSRLSLYWEVLFC